MFFDLFDVEERVALVLRCNFFSPEAAEKVAEAVSEEVYNELTLEHDPEEETLDEIDESQFYDAMIMPMQRYLDEHLA